MTRDLDLSLRRRPQPGAPELALADGSACQVIRLGEEMRCVPVALWLTAGREGKTFADPACEAMVFSLTPGTGGVVAVPADGIPASEPYGPPAATELRALGEPASLAKLYAWSSGACVESEPPSSRELRPMGAVVDGAQYPRLEVRVE